MQAVALGQEAPRLVSTAEKQLPEKVTQSVEFINRCAFRYARDFRVLPLGKTSVMGISMQDVGDGVMKVR